MPVIFLRNYADDDQVILADMVRGSRYEEYLDRSRHDCLTVAEYENHVAGFSFAYVFSGQSFIFAFVSPKYRRLGVGTALYREAERKAREGGCESAWSTFYNRDEGEGFARKVGTDQIKGNDYMKYAGGFSPSEDIRIRKYKDDDFLRCFYIGAYAWHDLRVRTGDRDSKPHLSDRQREESREQYARDADSMYVLEEDGQIVGFGSISGNEIDAVCVDMAQYNRGFGRAISIFLTNEILRRGNESANLWCEHGNDNARHIYSSIGYEVLYTGYTPIKKL